MPRRIDQVLAGFAEGDAISGEAVVLQDTFRRWGLASDIFADSSHVSPAMRSRCRSLAEYAATKDDLLIHHYSIASSAVGVFADTPARKLLIYHNITPAHFFEGFDDKVARKLKDARENLRELLPCVDAIWADSDFNAKELKEMGAANVRVLPLLFSPEQFETQPSAYVSQKFSAPMRNILFVGRIAPNKCVENLILAFAWYSNVIERQSRLIIVGSDRSASRYYLMLRMLAAELVLPNVCFEHFASAQRLPAYYDIADVFVTASEHEGYCLPVVEAMCKGVPVIAMRTGGIPEALGGAGVMYEEATPAELAELINRVIVDSGLRGEILESQQQRMAEITERRIDEELKSLLADLL